MIASLGVMLMALVGSPLFLVISAVAIIGFLSTGGHLRDVTGEISAMMKIDLQTIPLFTFAGYLLAESGAPRRLVAVSRALLGWFPGGMAIVAVATCAFFTTFTGASGITIVALGGLLLPVMLKQGYPRQFSLGLITTSGSRGLVFPPSLPVIIYGYIAAVDIQQLYVAGIIPGLIDVGIIALYCWRVGLFAKVPRTKFDGKAALKALFIALPEVTLPIWIMVLILTGVLQVPEAAALTALYVLFFEVVWYRDVHPFKDLPRITRESMVLCGAIMVILAASQGLTNYLVNEEIPQKIVLAISEVIKNKWVFLFALNIFLLIVGCLMDIFSAIVIVVPLISPLAADFGIAPIHLAIIFLINLELGYNTPPVGMNLFIASFRFRQPVIRLYRAAIPFVLLSLVTIGVITYVPSLSTFTVKGGGVVKGGLVQQPVKKSKTTEKKKTKEDDIDIDGEVDALDKKGKSGATKKDDDIDIDKEVDDLDKKNKAPAATKKDDGDIDIDKEVDDLDKKNKAADTAARDKPATDTAAKKDKPAAN